MKRRLKYIPIALVLLVLSGWLVMKGLIAAWLADPPALPADVSIMQAKPETRDGRTWLGESWVGTREGLPVIRLKGAPFDMGYASGVLLQDRMRTLEDEFLVLVKSYVPQQWKIDLLRTYIVYRNRNLSDFIPLDYRSQIHGTTLGCPDNHPEQGDYYTRLLNYHAAHDVSYMMIDNPLVSPVGCTAFGAWGGATREGHLVGGRNFDWEAAEVFSRDRIVILCEPDGGIPFVSLAWAGMAGVVSGMNREGVSVTINGAPSSLPRQTATPVAIVARQVLQEARNLEDALAIVRGARVFVSTLWLVGSRADGCFVVVEKTPDHTLVRKPEGDSIVCANHFESELLREDQRNTGYLGDSTSLARKGRMTELLAEGELGPVRAVEVLRDRHLSGGVFAGNGHRSTLNPFIATHAVVMDLTAGVFWAASPPNQAGRFVAFDVNDFDRELPELGVPADDTVASGELERARESRQHLVRARKALESGDAATALHEADLAEGLNPGFYENAAMRGQALVALARNAEAAEAFERALDGQPAFQHEVTELTRLLEQARATP